MTSKVKTNEMMKTKTIK